MSDAERGQSSGVIGNSRERISINKDWRFFKYETKPDNLIYDVRPEVEAYRDDKPADSRPTDATVVEATHKELKPWILPSGNDFIKNPDKRYVTA